jgi:hypothetical protein
MTSKSKLCHDWQSVGQSVFVSSTHLGPKTRYLLLSESCGFVNVGRLLWREGGSVFNNYCWPFPAFSFLGPSPARLVTIFYCLRFEISPTWKARFRCLYPPGTGWPSYTPRHWVQRAVTFLDSPRYIDSAQIAQKTPLPRAPLSLRAYPLAETHVYRSIA